DENAFNSRVRGFLDAYVERFSEIYTMRAMKATKSLAKGTGAYIDEKLLKGRRYTPKFTTSSPYLTGKALLSKAYDKVDDVVKKVQNSTLVTGVNRNLKAAGVGPGRVIGNVFEE
ncbi:hypothetical protein RZS08_34485, partial [Arthrospira platensis SPKY1]|nr:hypothetical protein [Arthrospira platensis SPKY1]